MKPETVEIYAKYRYFLFLLSNEKLHLFHKNEHELDYEAFFDLFNYGVWKHWDIKPLWKNYKKRRAQIIKKFEYGKYEILLRPHFCYDVRKIISLYLL